MKDVAKKVLDTWVALYEKEQALYAFLGVSAERESFFEPLFDDLLGMFFDVTGFKRTYDAEDFIYQWYLIPAQERQPFDDLYLELSEYSAGRK